MDGNSDGSREGVKMEVRTKMHGDRKRSEDGGWDGNLLREIKGERTLAMSLGSRGLSRTEGWA